MSKADDLRKMREANWYARQKPQTTLTPAQKRKVAEDALVTALAPPPPVTQECGHRSVGGKTCIRQQGHTEKQHKYTKAEKPKIDEDAEV